MPQNPYPYTRITAEDFVPGVPDSGTDVNAIDHNKQGGAAAYFANAIPLFKVDPNDTENCFATLLAAWTTADAELPAGAEARFLLADGDYPDNVDFGSDHPIVIEGLTNRGAIITGDLTFGNYAAMKRHLIRNCELSGTITIRDGTNLLMENCKTPAETAFVLDPTGGTVGYWVRLNGCEVFLPTILETSTSTGTRIFVIDGGTITFTSIPGTPISIYKLHLKFLNIAQEKLEWSVWMNPLIDCNNDAAKIWFSNFAAMNYYIGTGLTEWFTNEGSAWVFWDNAEIRGQDDGKTVELGSPFTTYGAPRIVTDVEPVNVPRGTIWVDWRLGDQLIWDGVYWGNHGVYRKDILVDIGAAALDHDIDWNVPSGAAVVSTSVKLLKALTGAAGAVQAGLGTGSGGDSDKYSETADLAADTKDQNLHGTFDDGGGDDLKITAETAPGTSGGTVAGSGDEDVRVLVRFRKADVLP